MTRRTGARSGEGAGARLAIASSALALALVASACGGGGTSVAAQPAPAVPQLGSVVPRPPSTPPPSNAPSCTDSLRPTGADASSAEVAAIRQRGKLVVGVAQDEYLTGYLDSTGTESGFDVDIAKQIEQAIFGTQDAGHIKFKALDNEQRTTALQSQDPADAVDIVVDTFTITCERARQVLFSSVYYTAHQRLLVLKDSGYRSLDDLGGKRVCAQSDSTSLQTIAAYPSHPIAYGVTNLTDCLVALQQGLVDAISTDDTILAGLAEQDPNTTVVPKNLESEPYGIAVPLGDKDLIRFVNGVLEQIRGNGVWQSIYGRWLQPALGPQQPPAAQYAD